MTTSNKITNPTGTINIYNNTNENINPDTYINTRTENFIFTKVCAKCRTIKNVTECFNDTSIKDGYRTQCKKCIAEYKQKYYNKNKDKI